MKHLSLCLLLAFFGAGNAQAQDAAPGESPQPWRLGVTWHGDALDHGYDHWQGLRVELGNEARGQAGGHVAVFNERRFGSDDAGIEFGAAVPLGTGWLVVPQVSFAPDADFLARAAGDVSLVRELGQGWVVSGGIGHSKYRDASVNRVQAGVERYVGAWRIGYQATSSHLHGRNGLGHDLRFARSYGDANEVGLQVNAGREPTVLAQGIVNADVKGAGLFGHHALAPDWTLWWNAGVTQQGDFYTRRGVGLGLQHTF